MKYIQADKLIAEIERRIKLIPLNCVEVGSHPSAEDTNQKLRNGLEQALSSIGDFITSVQQEQPEADLEKEIECGIRFLNGYHTLENGERWYKGRYEELRDFAHYFYSLGLNARKDE